MPAVSGIREDCDMNIGTKTRRAVRVLIAMAGLACSAGTAAADGVVRIGVLKFGTVNWEVDAIRHNGFDRANGFELQVVELASNDATRVAIQAGAVDVIVSDWLFVARQR